MTLDKAIEMLKAEYEKANNSQYVIKPLAYALYQVWKIADREIAAKITPQTVDLTDKCGSCKWAVPCKGSDKGVFGCYVTCQNPNKQWRHDVSKWRQRTTPKCRYYERNTENER